MNKAVLTIIKHGMMKYRYGRHIAIYKELMQQTQEALEHYYMQRLIYTIAKVLYSKDNENE